jgi:hypothetical protein
MKNLDVLLEGIKNIENQLVEDGIIKDGDNISEALGELKERVWNNIHKNDLKEFHSKLNDLVDEYHPHIYLNDKIFRGLDIIGIGILNELNKDK